MKNYFTLFLALALVTCGFAQCPPSGLILSSQASIDNFSLNYPGCTEISGILKVQGADITNLNGLSQLTSHNGDLQITDCPLLFNLNGLHNILTINAFLQVNNCDLLSDLSGLESLTSVVGKVIITDNANLLALTGLSSLNNIGWELQIVDNPQLAMCEVQGVCDFLAIASNPDLIFLNAPGCSSRAEIEAACAAGAPGCTDVAACNYDSSASSDDGSCEFPTDPYLLEVYNEGGGDPFSCDGTSIASVFADGGCGPLDVLIDGSPANIIFIDDQDVYVILYVEIPEGLGTFEIQVSNSVGISPAWTLYYTEGGCMDPSACNFNSEALCDNGSCLYSYSPSIFEVYSDDFGSAFNCDGSSIASIYVDYGCGDIDVSIGGTSVTVLSNLYGESYSILTCTVPTGSGLTEVIVTTAEGSANFFFPYTGGGCTYAFACNYDPSALCDDGSCEEPGCMQTNALNYNPSAACDNGLCVFDATVSCQGDLNDDLVVNSTDLLLFLASFGSICN